MVSFRSVSVPEDKGVPVGMRMGILTDLSLQQVIAYLL